MSLTLPQVHISNKQHILNSDGEIMELRLHDNKLYMMKLDSDGNITDGGEIILDTLPSDVLYGSSGETTNEMITASAELETPYDQWTEQDTEAAEDATSAATGGSATATASEGSTILDFEIFFDSSKSVEDIDAAVALVSTDSGVTSMFANTPSLSSIPVVVTPGFTPSRGIKLAPAKIISLTYTDGDPSTVTFTTIGPYAQISYKLATEATYTTITTKSGNITTGSGSQITINARLLNNDGAVIATKDQVVELTPPPIMSWSFDQNTVDLIGGNEVRNHYYANGSTNWDGVPATYVDSGDPYLGYGIQQPYSGNSQGYLRPEDGSPGFSLPLGDAYTIALWTRHPTTGSEANTSAGYFFERNATIGPPYTSLEMLSLNILYDADNNGPRIEVRIANSGRPYPYTDHIITQEAHDTGFVSFVCVAKRNEDCKVYMNGSLKGSFAHGEWDPSALDALNPLFFPRFGMYGGGISETYEARIYDYAFSAQQAQDYANKLIPAPTLPHIQPVVHWDFEQTTIDLIGEYEVTSSDGSTYVDSGDAYLGYGIKQPNHSNGNGYRFINPGYPSTIGDAYTFALWVRHPGTGSEPNPFVQYLGYLGSRGYSLEFNWGSVHKIQIQMAGSATQIIYQPHDTGFVSFVGVAKQGEDCKLYMNGFVIASFPHGDWDVGVNDLIQPYFGTYGGGISETYDARIYDYAFHPEQAVQYANKLI